MATTQAWETYENIIADVVQNVKEKFQEEEGEDFGDLFSELRAVWGQKLLQSGVLALADEVDPDAQRDAFLLQKTVVKTEEGTTTSEEPIPKRLKLDPVAEVKVKEDDLGEDELEDEDLVVDDLVLSLLEKRHKSKEKYRIKFKGGMVNIQGRDFVFGNGVGEFRW